MNNENSSLDINEFVVINNLCKKIKNKDIIKDLSLSIYEGEVFGLVGVNGAGKTTLMRMITGLIKPTSGSIKIGGENVCENEKVLANIGAIIEGPDLYKHVSGYMNLKIMANMYGNVSKERILELASLLGLKNRLNDKVKTYSLGMRQRLAIAIAMLNNPKLLVFDEPLNGLDPQGVREVRNILKELAEKEKVTVIISSHILSELELICDRFCIINEGVIKEIGNIQDGNQNLGRALWEIAFLDELNVLEVEKTLKKYNTIISSIKLSKIEIEIDDEAKAEFIKEMVNMGYRIQSVVPKRVSLEEYFVKRVGEV